MQFRFSNKKQKTETNKQNSKPTNSFIKTMKTKQFLAALLASAAVLASCSKETGVTPEDLNAPGQPMSLKLTLSKTISRSAPSTSSTDEDAVINDLVVFLTRNDGTFDVAPVYVANPTLNLASITATTRATGVHIICNTGPYATGPFAGVANLTQLLRVASALDGNPNAASNCISKNVWMGGATSSLTPGTPVGDVAVKTATVQLGYLPAKIYVTVNNNMENYDQGHLSLDGIAVVNGGAWTGFVTDYEGYKPLRSDLPAGAAFYYNGLALDPLHYADKPAAGDYMTKSLYNYTTGFPMTAGQQAVMQATEGFYVFPGITDNLTYVTVYGRYSADAAATTLSAPNQFFSAVFGGQDGLFSGIESGKKYLVTITLNGNANAGGGGTDDPTEEIVDALVDITIRPALWDVEINEKVIR